jgi:glycosyltransferase involved in cell wall biosynthesis
MTLALGTVVRNEEVRLPQLLDAVEGHVDQMIVVDQHSTDKTESIARAFGATLVWDECHGYADPSRPLLLEHCKCDWMLMLDADELPTQVLLDALDDLMMSRGAYLRRCNSIGGVHFSDEAHYRLFPIDNVVLGTTLHAMHHPLDPTGVVSPRFTAIDHDKSFREQIQDDEGYERLGQVRHPILDNARRANMTGEQIDNLPLEERKVFLEISR